MWERCIPISCSWHLETVQCFWKTVNPKLCTQVMLIINSTGTLLGHIRPWPYSFTVCPYSNSGSYLTLLESWFSLLKWQKSMHSFKARIYLSNVSFVLRGWIVLAGSTGAIPARERDVLVDSGMPHWLCCIKKCQQKESWDGFHLWVWTQRAHA